MKYMLKRCNQAKLLGKRCTVAREQGDTGPHRCSVGCSKVSTAHLLLVLRKQLLWATKGKLLSFLLPDGRILKKNVS